MPLKHLTSRNQLPEYLAELGHIGVGVELGVADGWFSNQILLHSKLRLLISIDPWSQSDPAQSHLAPLSQLDQARETLKSHGCRSCILPLYSFDAINLFNPHPDGLFDFIYVDANHEEDATTQDLEDWYPRLRVGGIFAGHDYCDFHSSVKQAVDAFVAKHHLTLYTTELDFVYEGHAIRTWYLLKPQPQSPEKSALLAAYHY